MNMQLQLINFVDKAKAGGWVKSNRDGFMRVVCKDCRAECVESTVGYSLLWSLAKRVESGLCLQGWGAVPQKAAALWKA